MQKNNMYGYSNESWKKRHERELALLDNAIYFVTSISKKVCYSIKNEKPEG